MDQHSGAPNVDVLTMYVKTLRNLEEEIQVAVHAIARNDLTGFEESLWQQETLCAKLKRSLPKVETLTSSAHLREALSHLKLQSEVYEKLITQSSRSTSILKQLCSLYRNAARRQSTLLRRTLSSEA